MSHKIFIISFLLFMNGCFTAHSSIDLLTAVEMLPEKETVESEYEKYGAYYLFDETLIEASMSSGFMKEVKPESRIVIHKRLKILNEKGMIYATIALPLWDETPEEYFFRMWDSSGKEVLLDAEEIFEVYRKTGKAVFPKAAPGIELELMLKYNFNSAVPSYEYWFVNELPVLKGRFTFSALNRFRYESKLYGLSSLVEESRTENREFSKSVWSVSNILPPNMSSYSSVEDLEIPRVALAMKEYRNGRFYQLINTNWLEICNQYHDVFFRKRTLASGSSITELVDRLTDSMDTEEEKAVKLFQWTRDSLLLIDAPVEAMNPGRILESREGNYWAITFILRELFKNAGIYSDIIMTRARSNGGFDPYFISPEQFQTPILTCRFRDGKRLVAFPFTGAAKLGEYPIFFSELPGINLMDGVITKIPEPSSVPSEFNMSTVIDLDKPETSCRVEISLKGYWAFMFRADFMDLRKQEQDDILRKMMTKIDKSNAFLTAEVENLEDAGEELNITILMRNQDNLISRNGQFLLSLNSYFSEIFDELMVNRSIPVHTFHQYQKKESIRFVGGVDRVEMKIGKEYEVENALFSHNVFWERDGDDLILNRNVKVNNTVIPVEYMGAICHDVQTLNKIKREYIQF